MDNLIIDFETVKIELKSGKYRYLGSGSARSVYDLENGYVVKAAKNKGGLIQNQIENKIYRQETEKLFAEVLAMSDDFRLLVMKKAERVKSLNQVLAYYQVDKMEQLLQEVHFWEIINKYNLVRADLIRRSSWGMLEQVPVLIDYGYTRDGGLVLRKN